VALKQLDAAGARLIRDVAVTVPGSSIHQAALDSRSRI